MMTRSQTIKGDDAELSAGGNAPAQNESGGGDAHAPGGAWPRATPSADGGEESARERVRPTPSVRSHASSTMTVRRRAAELRALERVAEIEKEVIKKRLELELEQIDAEGTPVQSRAVTPQPGTSKVDEWLSSFEHGRGEEGMARRPDGQREPTRETPLATLQAERAPSPPRGPHEPCRAPSREHCTRNERALSPPRGPREPSRAPSPERRAIIKHAQSPPRGYRDLSLERRGRTEHAQSLPRGHRDPLLVEPRVGSPHGQYKPTAYEREQRSRDDMHFRSSMEPPSDAATAFNRLAEQLKASMRPKPPKQVYELPYYSGDPSEWLLFYNAYRETTARYEFSVYENMARLRNCLRGEARQCVQHLLATSSQPDMVIRLLKKNFGRTDLLIDRALDELKRLPNIGSSAIDLNNFSTKVINIVSTLVGLDQRNYGDNPLLIREITDRLSPHLRSRWCQFARKQLGPHGTGELALLANFLLEESDAELKYSHTKAPMKRYTGNNGPSYTDHRTYAPRPDYRPNATRPEYRTNAPRLEYRPNAPQRGVVNKPPVHQTYAVENQEPCLCCGGNHRSTECKKVLSMNVGARWDWARSNRVCFKCLNRKHRREQCKAKGCSAQGCPHSHNRLLHEDQVQAEPPASQARSEQPRQSRNDSKLRTEQSCTSEVIADGESTTILLKVIPITIEGPLRRVETFALMDGGSTVSLADEELMKEVGAVGEEEPLRIKGVGSMATLNNHSKKMQIQIRGKNNGPLQTITVRTVRELGLRGQHMKNVNRYAHLSDLEEASYSKAVPRVLIGADNWHLMLPKETRMGKMNEPAAIKTPLGWVIFGRAPQATAWRGSETTLHCHLEDEEINQRMRQYFEIDSLGIKHVEKQGPENERATKILESTIKKAKHRAAAEQLWFQWAQRTDFANELLKLSRGETITKKSQIFSLDPVLDADGLLRMRGRINAAPVQGLEKRPVILNGHNPLVKLLILNEHRKTAHANHETVINNLRQRYWILHLRPTVRSVGFHCQTCKIRRARPELPAMGDLPLNRIQPYTRAFTNSAVDYFGPLVVTIGRRHEKRWVALFTCLTTRAIHLEVVATLSTDSAIMALRRLAARRGWPAVMFSDNATNFRGADQELRSAYTEWLPALQDYGVRRSMQWRFIPPGAPNQGGAWERLVRSVKTALAVTLHTKAPREEVLHTLLAEAENTVNARPLTHVSVDHRDEEALTPSHFLLGGSTGVPPTGPCDEADRRTWRASQALADHFWRRWVREYLPTLAPRQSSANQSRPIQPNDCVIVVDPNLPRNVWPRGIIRRVFPGPDGNVRSADVETRGGIFRRPVTKLAVLPVQRQPITGGENVTDSPEYVELSQYT